MTQLKKKIERDSMKDKRTLGQQQN